MNIESPSRRGLERGSATAQLLIAMAVGVAGTVGLAQLGQTTRFTIAGAASTDAALSQISEHRPTPRVSGRSEAALVGFVGTAARFFDPFTETLTRIPRRVVKPRVQEFGTVQLPDGNVLVAAGILDMEGARNAFQMSGRRDADAVTFSSRIQRGGYRPDELIELAAQSGYGTTSMFISHQGLIDFLALRHPPEQVGSALSISGGATAHLVEFEYWPTVFRDDTRLLDGLPDGTRLRLRTAQGYGSDNALASLEHSVLGPKLWLDEVQVSEVASDSLSLPGQVPELLIEATLRGGN